ncbi:endonuclease/exonuclease/phosphatase family protein [Falsiroseomonas sp. HW251]|uniref:endonuclease/exonuclease/phosphatase family protein n=1 Tax=Falsiroseomonas sp. HW251 TaxID=3390998 RepID=UPI003D313698
MKIAIFNINSVNKRLPNLLGWLAEAQPDVVCLQELKAAQHAFPATAIQAAGYGAVWQGQPTWNGVAILAPGVAPVETRRALQASGLPVVLAGDYNVVPTAADIYPSRSWDKPRCGAVTRPGLPTPFGTTSGIAGSVMQGS